MFGQQWKKDGEGQLGLQRLQNAEDQKDIDGVEWREKWLKRIEAILQVFNCGQAAKCLNLDDMTSGALPQLLSLGTSLKSLHSART